MASQVRQRTGKGPAASDSTAADKGAKSSSGGFGILDIARTVVFLFLASGLLSWFITGKDFYWGHRPAISTVGFWTDLLKSTPGPLTLTDAQLAAYDGSDPETPIYLALNGSIYDVTAGRRFYGPGGSYSHFSGVDATRAFATSCFDEAHRTPDLRDVELMHMPLDDPEIDGLYTKGQLKAKREQEVRFAKQKVKETLDHWIGFFSTSGKYPFVGYVKREPGWETKGSPPPLCEKAQDGRVPRPIPPGKKAPVKPVV